MFSKKNLVILIISGICLIVLVLMISACSDSTGYRKISVTFNKTIHYSFEYPESYYDIGSTYRSEESQSIIIDHFKPDVSPNEADKSIYISPGIQTPNYPNAKSCLDHLVSGLKEWDRQFELLSRSSIRVSGIKSEMIVFLNTYPEEPINKGSTQTWQTYIDYEGYSWEIAIMSDPKLAKEAEAEFKHLIKSFRFEQ